ncbi:MAG: transcriptional regulator, partial [Cytophagaceae bacterium]
MIDGKPYKMLKRHLSRSGYTPDSYREAFNLPRDYPMVAAESAAKRRTLAR